MKVRLQPIFINLKEGGQDKYSDCVGEAVIVCLIQYTQIVSFITETYPLFALVISEKGLLSEQFLRDILISLAQSVYYSNDDSCANHLYIHSYVISYSKGACMSNFHHHYSKCVININQTYYLKNQKRYSSGALIKEKRPHISY